MSDLIKTRKGIFIPDITVEMFRNASLEAVEELLVSGEMQDIILPSAEPERLTDDDFETIRIHLNAQKEKLCNQQRWEEAEEYQRIIDRFMAFASAESERKKGKWIHDNPNSFKCSKCNKYLEISCGNMKMNFCPNCWADMRGEEDENR